MTRIIDIDSVPLIERQHVREGVFQSRTLLTGEPNTPGNFSLQLSSMPQTYYSPRHRHNFDQVRFQIEGEFDFDSDGKMKPGSVAYFPEGTPYGPQTSEASSLTLVLQFGGASGSGYLSSEQYDKAQAELRAMGSFAKGVYTRTTADGRKLNKDAYQAIWEHVNGRPLIYPPPRYARPIFTAPENFAWVPIAGAPGASCKRLGEFTECRSRLAFYRVDEGSRLELEDHSIYFVISGSGMVDGSRFAKYTTIHVARAERSIVTAKESAEFLQLGLPYLSR
jgi:quercetin dioxygenase-like cupin family protein